MSVIVAGRSLRLDPRAIWGAIRIELASESLVFRAWLGFLGFLLLVLAVTAIISIPPGGEVFGTTPAFEWGLLIAAYVFFVVTTSGLCLVNGLGQVFGVRALQPLAKRAVILALLFLFAGFIIIALDLHYPLRLLFGVVLSPSLRSPMWWMGVLYGIYIVLLLIELTGILLGLHKLARLGSALAFANAFLAPTMLGMVFGSLGSRAYWGGALVPVQLFVTAVLSGASILAIACAVMIRLERHGDAHEIRAAMPMVGKVLAASLVGAALFTAWQTVSELLGTRPGQSAAGWAVVAGPLALQFWGVKVGIGIVAPLAILGATRGRHIGATFAAAVLTFAGVFVDRLILVGGGEIAPTTAASGIVSQGHVAYTPSLVEIGIVLGAAGFVGFFYTLAERFFDLTEHGHAVEEVAA